MTYRISCPPLPPQSTPANKQVVMTTIEPRGGGRSAGYDAFEYISHSHTYISDNQPTAKFTYDLSPIQVRGVVLELGFFGGGLSLSGCCWDCVCVVCVGGCWCVNSPQQSSRTTCRQYRCVVWCFLIGVLGVGFRDRG